MHPHKMLNTFYKDHPKKLTATSILLDFVLPIAKPIIHVLTKHKQERQRKAMKLIKWDNKESIQISLETKKKVYKSV